MNIILPLILLPFLGTTLGSACVFFIKNELNPVVQKGFLGFASGVMVAASIWSLIIPSMEMCENMAKLAFIPAAIGIAAGFGFLFLLDAVIPHLHLDSEKPDGPKISLKRTTMLFLAVTLHNIPEGMAVGVVIAGFLSETGISLAAAVSLALGIALQNFPEGAVISLPLKGEGNRKGKAFWYGTLSGIVEPIAALITLWLSFFVVPLLPYLLSFAAGAMLFVVVEELIPEASSGEHTNSGTLGFAFGFIIMLILDVALG